MFVTRARIAHTLMGQPNSQFRLRATSPRTRPLTHDSLKAEGSTCSGFIWKKEPGEVLTTRSFWYFSHLRSSICSLWRSTRIGEGAGGVMSGFAISRSGVADAGREWSQSSFRHSSNGATRTDSRPPSPLALPIYQPAAVYPRACSRQERKQSPHSERQAWLLSCSLSRKAPKGVCPEAGRWDRVLAFFQVPLNFE